MWGSVNINNCKFTHNNNYNNQGTAIHYSSNDNAQLMFMINNCAFNYNKGASIVYLYHYGTSQKDLSLGNSTFTKNKGVPRPVAILNQQIYLNGLVQFERNQAINGGGLFVNDHASVIFNEGSVVTFSKNIAYGNGGGVFVSNHSKISFKENSIVVFNNNTANNGGAVCAINNSIIDGISEVKFSDNSAVITGATVCYNKCTVLLAKDSMAIFTGNTATVGGAITL